MAYAWEEPKLGLDFSPQGVSGSYPLGFLIVSHSILYEKGKGVVVAKQAANKKSPAKKAPAKKAPAAKKAAAKKAPAAKKAAAKKAPAAKKAAAEKTAATKKSPAKKSPAKKATPKKAAAKASSTAISEVEKVDEGKAAAAARLKENQKVAKKAFTAAFLKKQEAELLKERDKYTKSAVSYREEADALVLDREPGDVQFDEESGEGDTLAVERERDLALSAQAQQAVEEIDAALERMKNGVYGVCLESDAPIPKERLEAIPWASVCVEVKVGGLGRR